MREIRTSGSTRGGWIERRLRPPSYSTGSVTNVHVCRWLPSRDRNVRERSPEPQLPRTVKHPSGSGWQGFEELEGLEGLGARALPGIRSTSRRS